MFMWFDCFEDHLMLQRKQTPVSMGVLAFRDMFCIENKMIVQIGRG